MITSDMENMGISPLSSNTAADSRCSGDTVYTVGGVCFAIYRIGEALVTQELWQAVMGNNPSFFTGSPAKKEVQCKRPVLFVPYAAAVGEPICVSLHFQPGEGLNPVVIRYYSSSYSYLCSQLTGITVRKTV